MPAFGTVARAGVAAFTVTLAACAALDRTASGDAYEVWMVDQSNSRGADHGGTLYVYAGSDLEASEASDLQPAAVIDLGGRTAELCLERTGANPVRPHMVLFNREHSHASIAFVASGHVVIFDAASRAPVDCLRMSKGAGGQQQAHAAVPAPDGSFILVANQNGKRLERIDADFPANSFVHNESATLDLSTCTTPGGVACELADVRPDNAPICPVISEASDLAFVTLRGGGMLVVDPTETPMRIVAEFDMATVGGNGCGGAEHDGSIYINSGGRPGPMQHLHLYGFKVYRFNLAELRPAGGIHPPNQPTPTLVFSADGEHDSHGMVLTGRGANLWVMDRHGDVVEVISTETGAHVGSIKLNGALTANAAPDLTDISPSGRLVFVALRGPTPLSGDPHNATGTTPGLGIIEVLEDGRGGMLQRIISVTNVGDDGVERADPHGLRVRRTR